MRAAMLHHRRRIVSGLIQRRKRRPNCFRLALQWVAEIRGHYADHGISLVVERNCASDNSRITFELLLPEMIANDDHMMIGSVLARLERSAQLRGNPQ